MSQNLISVSSLNTQIKSLLEATFMHVLVEGEVASCTYHTSGHLYFSVKDKESAIKCVMWRSAVSKMKFQIERGMHIVIEGSVGVYTPRGEYQFYAVHIEPYGKGALALAYEQLKEKLKAKGYFDPSGKKPIPKQIKKIALVTAKQSAALHDMLKIIEKRWALVEVMIVDTLVQGDTAARQIAHSLRYADTLKADVIVVGRGGGSSEDLWSFNEEAVADALFEMKTPVVSAVGHEVDVMISDFTADLRAPTPSAAIEMILPDSQEVLYGLGETMERYKQIVQHRVQKSEHEVELLSQSLKRASPLRRLQSSQQTSIRLQEEFGRVMVQKMGQYHALLRPLKKHFGQQMALVVHQKEQELKYLREKTVMRNPKLQCRSGWAKVSQEGRSVTLDSLKVDEKFVLEDSLVKVEAVCLRSRSLCQKK